MSNDFVIIKMCHVYNQWYDISCATLYILTGRHKQRDHNTTNGKLWGVLLNGSASRHLLYSRTVMTMNLRILCEKIYHMVKKVTLLGK